MNFKSVQPDMPAAGEKVSIIGRREIEPLLDKAQKILMHYGKAMTCSTALIDRNGKTVKIQNTDKDLQLCELCRDLFSSPSQTERGSGEERECPCQKIHHRAQAESRRINETYIYTCKSGFIFWTSPLYRNGRYAGALVAGQVLPDEGEEPAAGLCTAYDNKDAGGKFREMLKKIPRKSHAKIQAMARLLAICAEEISGKSEAPGEMIRRIVWLKENPGKEKTKSAASSPRLYPMEKERMLLAAFRRGDTETGIRILHELMDSIRSENPNDFEIVRFRAIELAVLLSRAALAAENSGSHANFETNDRYLRKVLESGAAGELTENLLLTAERMSRKIFSFQGIRHASVLRKAERFIWQNYTRKISLEEIAEAAGLSAPYFCTIFKEEMGESLSGYLNRLRVEKAALLLKEMGKSLNEIAGLCGFEDQSWFSKIFKNYTGMSPGKFRAAGNRTTEFGMANIRPKAERGFPEPIKPGQGNQNLMSS